MLTRVALLILVLSCALVMAEPAGPASAPSRMPVREVTVFKDGHALLLHQGRMAAAGGNVVLDALPTPVLGTFWPYSADKAAKLVGVTAAPRKVKIERTALNVRELIEANIGADVTITESPVAAGDQATSLVYPANIHSVPAQSGEELEATSPPGSGEMRAKKGQIVLLKTKDGIKAVPFDRIMSVTFAKPPQMMAAEEEFRNLLTLRLDWGGQAPAREAEVGMLYLQKGLRWIPGYKVEIDGSGGAMVKLQATLINEMIDLEDAKVHLVVGVPSFMLAPTIDPVALQQTVAHLSQYFGGPDLDNRNFLSNAMVTQVALPARRAEARAPQPAPADLGPEIAGGGKAEDLYVFTLERVSLKKGQRMVVPVMQASVTYKDLYALNIPISPPPEVFRSFDDARKAEIAKLLASPRVMHKIRLANKASAPFTTAPAIIFTKNQVLAQGMMTYTPVGGSVDLEITATVDVNVKKSEREVSRTPRAQKWNGDDYMRVDSAGTITLANFTKQPLEVEVTRHVMGTVDSASEGGKSETLNNLEDSSFAPTSTGALPHWHGWYSWPWWWHRFNGIARITWTASLEPGKPLELNYAWHYFWR